MLEYLHNGDNFMKKIAFVAAAIVALSAAFTLVAKERDPNERAINAREAAFTLMAANVGPMGAMAKGKMPFDKEQFALRAANLDALSKMPWEFFIPGSDKGKSEAKPEIWSKADDFKKKADEFQQEVAKLVEVSKGDDQDAMFAQLGETAKACKSCHKEYKKKD
jgi:cytochrome c556